MTSKPTNSKKILPTVMNVLSLYGIFFTVATIANSILALANGHTHGTHEHVLLRAVIVLIAVLSIAIVGLPLKLNIWLRCLIAYAAAIALVLGYTWLNGQLFTTLHPDAYRDIFISVSIFYIPGVAAYAVGTMIRRRRKNAE